MSTETPQSALPSRLTLTSLPAELLSSIAHLSDRSTVLALARVAPILTQVAQKALYRHLNLRLNPHYGKLVWVEPEHRVDAEDTEDEEENEHYWREGENSKLLKEYEIGLEAKIGWTNETVDEGNPWPLVREISLELRAGVVKDALYALEHASNAWKIETSALGWMFDEQADEEVGFDDSGLLDLAILSGKISFPCVTHLRLGQNSLRYAETVGTLCNVALNLTHLDVNLDYIFPNSSPVEYGDFPKFPPSTGPTKIIDLRVAFQSHHIEQDDDWNVISEAEPAVISLLQRVPLLKRLSIKYNEDSSLDGASEVVYRRVADIIKGCEYLEDLEWGSSPRYIMVFKGYDEEKRTWGIPSLRRLALKAKFQVIDYNIWPPMPNVEIVHFTRITSDSEPPLQPVVLLLMSPPRGV